MFLTIVLFYFNSLLFDFDFSGWALRQNVVVPRNDQHRFAFMGEVAWYASRLLPS